MSAIDPTARRSADVSAQELCLLAKVSEEDFSAIASRFPHIWRHLAKELAARLRARTALVNEKRSTPRLFLASSKEALPLAESLADLMKQDGSFEIALWTDEDVFMPGLTNIEALEEEIKRADFAVLFLTPDDITRSRKHQQKSPRDNVIFELGLFAGTLGRRRALMACPSGTSLKIPSDLLGVSPVWYDVSKLPALAARLTQAFSRLGAR